MITYTYRTITDEERQRATTKPTSLYKRVESFIMIFIGIYIVLDIPLLIYDHFKPVSSQGQAIYCIVIGIIDLALIVIFTRRMAGKRRLHNAVMPKQLEIINVETTKAVRREDFEDFGVAFYIDVIDKGQQKVLFLWGQYLDDLEFEESFPNTAFEIIRFPGADEFLEFRVLGDYLKEERTLPAFKKEVWESGQYPVNGQLIATTIDEILE